MLDMPIAYPWTGNATPMSSMAQPFLNDYGRWLQFMSTIEEKWEPLDWTSKRYAKVLLFRWIFFFLNIFLITSELQTERVTKDEWVHTICSSGDESAAFLQTLNKYVSYCFDASCDQNNVGSAAVLRDQDWNAIGQRGEFWTSCDRGYNGKNSKYLIKCYCGLNEWTHCLTFRERSFSVCIYIYICIYIYLPFFFWMNPI